MQGSVCYKVRIDNFITRKSWLWFLILFWVWSFNDVMKSFVLAQTGVCALVKCETTWTPQVKTTSGILWTRLYKSDHYFHPTANVYCTSIVEEPWAAVHRVWHLAALCDRGPIRSGRFVVMTTRHTDLWHTNSEQPISVGENELFITSYGFSVHLIFFQQRSMRVLCMVNIKNKPFETELCIP